MRRATLSGIKKKIMRTRPLKRSLTVEVSMGKLLVKVFRRKMAIQRKETHHVSEAMLSL